MKTIMVEIASQIPHAGPSAANCTDETCGQRGCRSLLGSVSEVSAGVRSLADCSCVDEAEQRRRDVDWHRKDREFKQLAEARWRESGRR